MVRTFGSAKGPTPGLPEFPFLLFVPFAPFCGHPSFRSDRFDSLGLAATQPMFRCSEHEIPLCLGVFV